jgi:hypothetical protein
MWVSDLVPVLLTASTTIASLAQGQPLRARKAIEHRLLRLNRSRGIVDSGTPSTLFLAAPLQSPTRLPHLRHLRTASSDHMRLTRHLSRVILSPHLSRTMPIKLTVSVLHPTRTTAQLSLLHPASRHLAHIAQQHHQTPHHHSNTIINNSSSSSNSSMRHTPRGPPPTRFPN